ncbi:hypothetical protein [Devosia aurantiaca]|uniref:Histidine kinase n=1 Tax=Devosia aurantiaca TaxID=2714858 RepID=A0A6M1SP46_9HYPH|nr:hypothetical protein [Devosia aurantiaca]NGP18900.1 hypothetical protein [Devosia aurantiaca]
MSELPTSNDNRPSMADAHGRAALLMTESLLHSLIAKSIISVAEAVEVVETVISVEKDAIADVGDSDGTIRKSLALLQKISTSLSHDLNVPT